MSTDENTEVWREGLEAGGLRANFGKTKIMKCEIGSAQTRAQVTHLGVCKKGDGRNSILCSKRRK